MANNTITISFDPCEPAPVNGYRIYYRPVGGGAFRFISPRFFTSPAVIVDTLDPIGTSYEGFIQGDCGDNKFGLPIPWQAQNEDAPSASESGSGSEPAVPCRTYVLSQTVGSPSAHYIDCNGITRDTSISSMTSICTNGHGFTISGGGITVNSFTDGPCGGTVMSNPFRVGTGSGTLCSIINVQNLFWLGPGGALVPGNTMYTDAGLTTPVTGWNFISDSVGTLIYNIDSVTGVIGFSTGSGC